MDRCQYNKFVGCNVKERLCDNCEIYRVYHQGKTDAIEECIKFVDEWDSVIADALAKNIKE